MSVVLKNMSNAFTFYIHRLQFNMLPVTKYQSVQDFFFFLIYMHETKLNYS